MEMFRVPSTQERDQQWADLWAMAHIAAELAVLPYDREPRVPFGRSYLILRPATCSFVRYLRRYGIGDRGIYGGWMVGYQYGDVNECRAYTDAMREILVDAGFQVESHWGLD
jgi:hypothetical protein